MSAVEELIGEHGAAVVKVPSGRGGRGIYVVNPEAKETSAFQGTRELHMPPADFVSAHVAEVAEHRSVMVMEPLQPPAFDLDVLAWQGRAVHLLPRKRLFSALPNEGHVIVRNESMRDIGRRIVEGFQASWLFDIDFMLTDTGAPAVLEINPRASGSVAVPLAAGVPLIDDLLSLIAGDDVTPIEPPYDALVFPHTALHVSPAGEWDTSGIS